ncbi:hypothetical protein C0991_007791, partial [Blastosporella zonata]
IFYEKSNLTVQIIARHWKYTLNANNSKLTTAMLSMFLQPDHPRHIAYVRSHSLEATTTLLISKIYLGLRPSATLLKQKKTKALMATFAKHLLCLSGRAALAKLDFLGIIIATAKKDDAEPKLAKAVLKSTPF